MEMGSYSAGLRSRTLTHTTQSASHVPPLSPQVPFKRPPSHSGGGLGVQRPGASTSPALAGLGVNLTLYPLRATLRAVRVPMREGVSVRDTWLWGALPLPGRDHSCVPTGSVGPAGGRKSSLC